MEGHSDLALVLRDWVVGGHSTRDPGGEGRSRLKVKPDSVSLSKRDPHAYSFLHDHSQESTNPVVSIGLSPS